MTTVNIHSARHLTKKKKKKKEIKGWWSVIPISCITSFAMS